MRLSWQLRQCVGRAGLVEAVTKNATGAPTASTEAADSHTTPIIKPSLMISE